MSAPLRLAPGTFGAIVREKRRARHLTMKQLAAQLGCTWQTVHLWETNKRSPNLRGRAHLEAVLGMTPEEFALARWDREQRR